MFIKKENKNHFMIFELLLRLKTRTQPGFPKSQLKCDTATETSVETVLFCETFKLIDYEMQSHYKIY